MRTRVVPMHHGILQVHTCLHTSAGVLFSQDYCVSIECALSVSVPSSFEHWYVETGDRRLSTAELDALVLNVPADRTEHRPLVIDINSKEDPETLSKIVEALQERMQRSSTYAHVTVRAFQE